MSAPTLFPLAMSPLPEPSAAAAAHSQQLVQRIQQDIAAAGGWVSFARFMELALYAPGLGYYAAGARKFGAAGDFVTAPEMTPLFGQALARQLAQIMAASAPQILEAGAGTGRLAADLLLALEAMQALPERYLILELSADLKERQRETLAQAAPHLLARVEWLERLPERFSGAIVGNEVLDAMPVHLVVWREAGLLERGVSLHHGQFVWAEQAASERLADHARQLGEFPPGYQSEIALAAPAWAAAWGSILETGAAVLIDYGFPRREFYHPQRTGGTLMCHYRHFAHPDPFYLPGLQDITAHVDFTAIIIAADAAGLGLGGYTSQGQFLLNCGILDRLAEIPADSLDYVRAAGAVNKLVMPHEMGELFKVMALTKGMDAPLLGFTQGEQSFRL